MVVLTFHGVGNAGPGDEAPVWVRPDRFEEMLDVVAGRPDVAITFDDGNRSDVDVALPALLASGLTATFFVVAGRLGAPGYLDANDLRSLAAARMGIGVHGMWHRPWRGLAARELDEELHASRLRLGKVLRRPLGQAACPFGAYDRRVLAALRAAGYGRVYTSDGGRARPGAWLQPRNTVGATDDAASIERLLEREGARRRLSRAGRRAVKRWR